MSAELGSPTSVSDWAHFLNTEVEYALAAAKYSASDGTPDTKLTILDASHEVHGSRLHVLAGEAQAPARVKYTGVDCTSLPAQAPATRR